MNSIIEKLVAYVIDDEPMLPHPKIETISEYDIKEFSNSEAQAISSYHHSMPNNYSI